jgi:hypothetical protein
MTPGDKAAWQSACDPEFDAIARGIVNRIDLGKLNTFRQIERAIAEAIDRSPFAQPAWVANLCRALPSAFEFDDAAVDGLATMIRQRTAPDAVRNLLERAIPTHYRNPTPLYVRILRVAPDQLGIPTSEQLDRLIATKTPVEIDDLAVEWLTTIFRMDHVDYVECLGRHIALRAIIFGYAMTPSLMEPFIDECVASSPLMQRAWIAAYVKELPGHPQVPAAPTITNLTRGLRQVLRCRAFWRASRAAVSRAASRFIVSAISAGVLPRTAATISAVVKSGGRLRITARNAGPQRS